MHLAILRRQVPVDDIRVACGQCGSLLDIKYDWSRQPVPKSLTFSNTMSTKGTGLRGSWIFRVSGGFGDAAVLQA